MKKNCFTQEQLDEIKNTSLPIPTLFEDDDGDVVEAYSLESLVGMSENNGMPHEINLIFHRFGQKKLRMTYQMRSIEVLEDYYNNMSNEKLNTHLSKEDVAKSAFAVIPDAERLDIGSNEIIAVFKHRHQAEDWAKSMWEKFYLIEEVRSEHFR